MDADGFIRLNAQGLNFDVLKPCTCGKLVQFRLDAALIFANDFLWRLRRRRGGREVATGEEVVPSCPSSTIIHPDLADMKFSMAFKCCRQQSFGLSNHVLVERLSCCQ